MGIFSTASAPKLVEVGLRRVVYNNFKSEPWFYPGYTNVETSVSNWEEYFSMYGINAIPEVLEDVNYPEGQLTKGNSLIVYHKQFALVLKYGQIMKEDEKYGFLRSIGTFLSNGMRESLEVLAATPLNNAATTLGADGVYLLSTSHPALGGLLMTNTPAVQIDLGYTSAEAARNAIMQRKTFEGHVIPSADDIILVHPSALTGKVEQIYSSDKIPFSSDNTTNWLRNSVKPMRLPYLTDANAYFYIEKPNPDGCIFFIRVAPSVKEYIDNQNDATAIRMRARVSCAVFDIRKFIIWGSTGSS